MNFNGLLNMVLRQVTHRATNYGIDRGAEMLARRGKKVEDMTDQEREETARSKRSTKDMVQRARKMARISRRMR
ncbi:hypothetical protein [Paracoccus aerodenitrificans]|uniref:hypothetical protein n=1 Tax=Paracoccus aerodenitrificans TaxID=3017781 RepID=UPI0022F01845|nr:hypothetical protein [Paracoccus aerodenitrificans]WBU65255.1 hypothetical protein PAE61_07510 [Paracoccus aerodenitrificans]